MNTHKENEDAQPAKSPSPFSAFLPFLAGIAAGLLMRFIFSDDEGNPLSVMSGAFVFGAPLLIGAVTVFVAERLAPRRWRFYAGSGALAVLLFILGTMPIMIRLLLTSPITFVGSILATELRVRVRAGLTKSCSAMLEGPRKL